MKKYLNLASALIASFQLKSQLLESDVYLFWDSAVKLRLPLIWTSPIQMY